MKFLKTIIAILILSMTIGKINVSASAIPIGISPEMMEFGEFCSWIMLLFGVHGDQDNPSNDYINDSDFLAYLADEFRNTEVGLEGYTLQQSLDEVYQSYLQNKYKLQISRRVYDSLSEAIKNVFNHLPEITVQFQGEDTVGEYTSQSTINQLKSMYSQSFFDELTNNIDWSTYWTQQQNNIKGIYSNVNFYQDYSNYTRIQYYIYFSRSDNFNLDIANKELIFNSGSVDRFNLDCYIYQNNTHAMYISKTTNLSSPISYVNTMDTIYKDNSTYGQVLIDAGIQSLIDADKNTLITSYTDSATADTIEVAIPSDVSRILTDVQDRLISVSQAITQAQATVVDSTDSNAVEQANIAVYNPSPKYQTYGLEYFFPFCIPFDFKEFINKFRGTPTTPEFDIMLPNGSRTQSGELQYYEQHVDLHFLDVAALVVRKIELIGYCIFLCKVTRSIMIRS